ncbi:hypothetical protein ABL778_002948 [Escherichia coli]|uniref:hypothetical protein n=1 Tax=Escherichia coli TaxID=562 RepID=UPI0003911E76|nr:hypothetical protein [Escherichia coli]EEX3604115.1 hypothetical protein [Escherichia coli O157:H7]API37768.1 hypothetical protein BFL17_13050 [Escherichia coli]EEC7478595.1 hypothetical protein [Escherichia coli]EEC7678499.1 hypothetical protein [Escherichia coli]EEC7753787.1 hypothetical protein [Escherichia coli]
MITPLNILEEVAAQIKENTSMLEFIFKNSPDSGETDDYLCCLIRSMNKTCEMTCEYIDTLRNE